MSEVGAEVTDFHVGQRVYPYSELARQKERPRQADTQYLKPTEELICEEFAVVLNTTPDLVQERLHAVMRRRATAQNKITQNVRQGAVSPLPQPVEKVCIVLSGFVNIHKKVSSHWCYYARVSRI